MAIGDRLVSETAGVATLVLFTVLVTASVGIGVLFVDTDGSSGPTANFTFDYSAETDRLTITHAEGQEFKAGNLVFVGPNTETTWAKAREWNETRKVTQGDIVRLGPDNAYGERIRATDTIRVVYAPKNGNRTTLDKWNGTAAGTDP